MPFLSSYFELNNILSNHPPKVTVIFHEKRIGILSKLQKVISLQDFLIHKKVPESGLVSKFIAESHRRHEIPKHKVDSFLFENVNFLDGKEISQIKKVMSKDGRVVLLYALPAAEMRLLEEGKISDQFKEVINASHFSLIYSKTTTSALCVEHKAIPCFTNYKFIIGA